VLAGPGPVLDRIWDTAVLTGAVLGPFDAWLLLRGLRTLPLRMPRHNDNGQDEVSARKITFVYFFHREPKVFEGGELRIQSPVIDNAAFGSGNYYTIVPRQNQLVLFDSSLTHEITPVKCSSGKFADSRFTVNGWISR